jgi:transposase
MSLDYKAGDKLFVDFTRATRTYVDHSIKREAQLFVAILGASQYMYVEAVRSQKKLEEEGFLSANRNDLIFLGGVPQAIVYDNLKSGVTEADRYESVINAEFDHFASHHGIVILHSRLYSPMTRLSSRVPSTSCTPESLLPCATNALLP